MDELQSQIEYGNELQAQIDGLQMELAAALARVEAAEAKLNNQPQGYLAALDARDEAQLYLMKIMAVLDLVVNDTTYDGVVKAVKTLRARVAQLEAGRGNETLYRVRFIVGFYDGLRDEVVSAPDPDKAAQVIEGSISTATIQGVEPVYVWHYRPAPDKAASVD